MSEIKTFICENLEKKAVRLDHFLMKELPDYSRSYLQKRIISGDVLVNNEKVIKSRYLVSNGAEIVVTIPPEQPFDLIPQDVPFDIVFIHDDFVIINKPAGLLVHVAHSAKSEVTLVHGLLYRFKELEAFGDKERPGIVHRLDRDTSGLIIVARNISAHGRLAKLFKDRTIKKTYLAIVRGQTKEHGIVSYPIGRNPGSPHKMSHRGFAARQAQTNYETVAHYKDSSLVAASPITGRTHQIRVHFAAIGHGLLGDGLYGITSKHIKRQALHAWKLSFMYKDKEYSFVQPIPKDMQYLLKQLSLRFKKS